MSIANPTHDEFLAEWNGFRTIMCSSEATMDTKFDAWRDLLDVFIRCTDGAAHYGNVVTQAETRQNAMDMLMAEFPLRMGLEMGLKLRDIFEEMVTLILRADEIPNESVVRKPWSLC